MIVFQLKDDVERKNHRQPAFGEKSLRQAGLQQATMYTSETKVRVRYAETDQMRYVYYGNYAVYFEVGRTEALRKLGMSYRSLEEGGIMLPAIEYNVKFLKPVFYDEELTIKTIIRDLPNVRIRFFYEVFNEKGVLVCTADTTLVFVNMKNNRPCAAPGDFLNVLKKYFL